MLLTGSGDEFCGLLSALFQALAYHPPTVGPSAFLVFVYSKFAQRSAPCHCPLLWCAQSTPPSLLCVLFSSLFIIQFFSFVLFCFAGWRSLYPGAMLVYPRDSCGSTTCSLFAHLLVCVSQVGLEPGSGATGALLFPQCNVAWRSFVRAGGLGY
jgi:hypothetical protein